MTTSTTVLSVSSLSVVYRQPGGLFTTGKREFRALDSIDLELEQGKILAVVGESGSGKTTLAKSLVGLIQPVAGNISHQKKIQYVFQDPYASLNPGMTIEQIIREPLQYLTPKVSATEMQQRVREIIEQVGLDYSQRHRYPHEFSGGQCQRVAIARAIISRPDILVCDEPVSALDVSVRAQVINLLDRLNKQYQLSQIFISHDLWLTHKFTDDMIVLYHGKIVESGPTRAIFDLPRHPYTRALIDAIPVADPKIERQRNRTGEQPVNVQKQTYGCAYAVCCPRAAQQCFDQIPLLEQTENGTKVACFYPMDE